MLHKKRKPSTFTSSSGVDCKYGTAKNNMLHSKSTYFYRWVSNLGVARRSYNSTNGKTSSKVGHDFTNEFRESSHHCEKGSTASGAAHTILTRSRRQTNSYSKITDRPNYIVPVGCSLALLLGLGIIINPAAGKIETVHAAESSSDKCMNGEASSTGQCPMELSLTMSGANGTGAYEEAGATQLEVGKTAYRSYDFKVSATDIDKDGYKLYATAVETKLGEIDLTNQLVNADYPDKETFIPISTTEGVLGESITAGQWGYAIAGGGVDSILPTVDTANTNPGSLTYKAVPTNQTTPIATGTETTTTDSGIPDNPATVPDEYRLIFGAKANEGMASGHYRTQVMLSLVADAKNIVISMQEFATAGACEKLSGSKQLRDARDDKLYWISKVNGQCIMTQNLDFDIPEGTLSAAETDIGTDWTTAKATKTGTSWSWTDSNGGQIESYDSGLYYINQATSSWTACSTTKNPAACNRYTAITDPNAAGDENLHYAAGNYYNWYAATAGTGGTGSNGSASGSICPKGWKLFDNAGAKSFQTILSGKNQTTVRQDPVYFPAAGYAYSSGLSNVGSYGNYWSSTRYSNSDVAYRLYFNSSSFAPQNNDGRYRGYSVRCVVK